MFQPPIESAGVMQTFSQPLGYARQDGRSLREAPVVALRAPRMTRSIAASPSFRTGVQNACDCCRTRFASLNGNTQVNKKWARWAHFLFTGAPGRIRTCDPRIRNPVLYPTELRAHGAEF